MSLRIDVDTVTAVLLADGWHEVADASFVLDAYEYLWSGNEMTVREFEKAYPGENALLLHGGRSERHLRDGLRLQDPKGERLRRPADVDPGCEVRAVSDPAPDRSSGLPEFEELLDALGIDLAADQVSVCYQQPGGEFRATTGLGKTQLARAAKFAESGWHTWFGINPLTQRAGQGTRLRARRRTAHGAVLRPGRQGRRAGGPSTPAGASSARWRRCSGVRRS